ICMVKKISISVPSKVIERLYHFEFALLSDFIYPTGRFALF
ncbi:MAG: hypothetical protein JWN78_1935, partial [Bacteroidota bacterium]|nr:hypothetical protein [Bacteroidota bacterium]